MKISRHTAMLVAALLSTTGLVYAAGEDVTSLRQAALMVRTFEAVVAKVEVVCAVPDGTSPLLVDWRSRNSRYTAAADRAIEQQFSGPEQAKAASVRVNEFAARMADELVQRRTREDRDAGCTALQSDVRGGEFDLGTQLKVARETEALLRWADQH